ncbi:MAG: hypothetical protein NTZ17_09410 [Phycisphaerae bacterium]|nr:hypothetical protein [Phycisphaerae bacterium]
MRLLTREGSSLILSNPLIRRYRCSLFRPANFWIYMTIYVSVVLLLLFINSVASQIADTPITQTEFYRGLYAQFLLVEVAILWVWATSPFKALIFKRIA